VNTSKFKLAMLLAGFMVPLVLATWQFMLTDNDSVSSTTNKGILISPLLDLPGLGLVDSDGQPAYQTFEEMIEGVDPDDYDPRPWQLLFLATADCDDACIERLYNLRQMHIRLNRESERVQRVYVLVDAPQAELAARIQEGFSRAQPDLRQVRGNPATLKALLAPYVNGRDPVAEHYIFVADPVGNIMLYFTPENSLEDILHDIDKLLDRSSLG
jgi:hypothetical protein